MISLNSDAKNVQTIPYFRFANVKWYLSEEENPELTNQAFVSEKWSSKERCHCLINWNLSLSKMQ